jgi:hypothetical protein
VASFFSNVKEGLANVASKATSSSSSSASSSSKEKAEYDVHGNVSGVDSSKNYTLSTGGQIDELVVSLIRSAHDADARTRKALSQALVDVGMRQPNLVASAVFDFLVHDQKHSQAHRVQLLDVAERVLNERRDACDAELLRSHLLSLALADLVRVKDVVPDWQGAASQLAVSIGMRFPDDLMRDLLALFSPGTVPHYFVIKTFADFVPANALAAVPKLKEVLARILPVLASIKAPNIKWVFATALGNFCEAILHYVANVEDGAVVAAGQQKFTLESFSSEVFPCYEVLFAQWLPAKEAAVRLATIKSLGSMCAVMTRANFAEQLPRLLPALLALYKKEKEQLPITQGMCSVLAVAAKDNSAALEPLLPALFAALHPLACTPVDMSDSNAVKNSNELHRCFGIIGTAFAEPIVSFLIGRLEVKDVRVRVGTLQIFKHLVTRNERTLAALKSTIMAGVKPLVVREQDLKVRKALAQLIVSLAAHQYLLLEGGEAMIDFVVRNSATSDAECADYKPPKSPGAPGDEDVSPAELRDLCDNVLNLVTTTVEGMDAVLWPYLFESLVKPELSGAVGVVCKCLAYIAHQKREAEAADFIVDFDRAVNLPKPPALLARLLVAIARPHGRNALGAHVLHLLRAAGPLLHPAACDMWDAAAPRLLQYLAAQQQGGGFQQARWEELVLRLLEKTLAIADDDAWAMGLGDQYVAQLALYNAPDDADLKKVALKHIGVVLQKLQHREFIRAKLDAMIINTNHRSDVERQGCAQGFGYAAATHTDMVVDYLVNVDAPPDKDAPGGGGGGGGGGDGFLGGLFSKKPAAPKPGEAASGKLALAAAGEYGKATIVLCYGYVCAYGPPSQVTARVDVHIVASMTPHMANAKSLAFKRAAIATLDLIGKAVHPSHIKQAYTLKKRDDMLRHLVNFITSGEVNMKVRAQGLAAAITLCRLSPALPVEEETNMLAALLPFFDLKPGQVSDALAKKKESKEDAAAAAAAAAKPAPGESEEELFDATQEHLRTLLLVLLAPKPDAETLVRHFRHLEKWSTSAVVAHRERAIAAILALLNEHLRLLRRRQRRGEDLPPPPDDEVLAAQAAAGQKRISGAPKVANDAPPPKRGLEALGACVAMCVPRCTDPSALVRPAAVAAIETLLYTDHILSDRAAAARDAAASAGGDDGTDAGDSGGAAGGEGGAGGGGGGGGAGEGDAATGGDAGDVEVSVESLPERIAVLRVHRAAIATGDQAGQYRVLQAIAKDVLARRDVLHDANMLALLMGCLRGLGDPEASSTSGTCVVLNSCISARGTELLPQVKVLTNGLLAAMNGLSDVQSLNGTLHAVRTLASHHLLQVMNTLLDRPLPYTQHAVKALQVLAKDASLQDRVIEHLTDLCNNGQLYDDMGDPAAAQSTKASAQALVRVPNALAMCATAALTAVLSFAEAAPLVDKHYALLATTLVLRVGTAQNCGPPAKELQYGADVRAPAGAVDALRAFLERAGDRAPTKALDSNNGWASLTTRDYPDAVAALIGAVVRARPTQRRPVYEQLSSYCKGNFVPQRIVAVVALGEMVCHAAPGEAENLLERLIQALLSSLIDPPVKRFALRGLGNVVAAGEAATNLYAPTVLDALTSSMEHEDEDIVLEAMAGLSKVFGVVEQARVQPILVNICHRIRPAFAKQNDGIRAEAFRLFGTLARFGDGQSAEAFHDQFHGNLPLLLLHIADDSAKVCEACREALVRLAPLARHAAVTEFLQGRHLRPGRSLQYGEFLDDVAKVLIDAYPRRISGLAMSCVENFKSTWDTIKGNAALMVGVLLTNIDVARRREYHINPMLITRALQQLLTDRSPLVRRRVAESAALLHTY